MPNIEESIKITKKRSETLQKNIVIAKDNKCKESYIKEMTNERLAIENVLNELKEVKKQNEQYLQKLVYALTPTTHELDDTYNNEFKKIISDNINLPTYEIKKKLKDYWED